MKFALTVSLVLLLQKALAGVNDILTADANVVKLSDAVQQQDACLTEAVESSPELTSPATLSDDDRLGTDMGEAQVVTGANAADIARAIHDGREYMRTVVMVDEKYSEVRDICVNKNAQCAYWASIGECEKNPGYMQVNCAPVCKSCEQLHVEVREGWIFGEPMRIAALTLCCRLADTLSHGPQCCRCLVSRRP